VSLLQSAATDHPPPDRRAGGSAGRVARPGPDRLPPRPGSGPIPTRVGTPRNAIPIG